MIQSRKHASTSIFPASYVSHQMWSDRLLEYSAFLTSPPVDPNESAPGSPAQPLCSVAANFDAGSPEIHLNTHAAMRLISSVFFRRGKNQIKVGVSTSDVKRLEPAMRHLWIQSGLPHAGRNRTFVDNMKDVLFRGTTAEQELLEPSQTCDDDSRDASQQVFTDDYWFSAWRLNVRVDTSQVSRPGKNPIQVGADRASLTFESSGTIKFRPLWRQISLNRAAAKASPAPVEDLLHHAANARVSLQKGRASLANVNATQQHARTHLDT